MVHSEDTIYYQEGPQCILLLHGYFGSIQEIGRTARALRKAGYSVYAFNLARHGTHSARDIFNIQSNTWIQQVDEAVRFLEEEGFNQIAIMGLSLGGILALNAVQENPQHFTAVGVFNSPCINGLDPTPIRQYTIQAIRRILSHRKWSDLAIEAEVEQIGHELDEQIKDIDTLIRKVRHKLSEIHLPVYIAKSLQDELINPATQDELARELTQAEVHLDSFEHGTHVITTSRAFRDFQDALINYLDQLEW